AVISENDAGMKPTSSITNGTSRATVFGSPIKLIAKFAAAINISGRINARMNIGARMRQSVKVSPISRRVIVRIALTLTVGPPRDGDWRLAIGDCHFSDRLIP